jgi:hypothetical protein
LGFGGQPVSGDVEGFGGGVDGLVVLEGGVELFGGRFGGRRFASGRDVETPEAGLDARECHVGGGGQLVERFACLVAAGELVVGQSHVGEFARWDGLAAGSELAPAGRGWPRPCHFRPMLVGGSGKWVGQ